MEKYRLIWCIWSVFILTVLNSGAVDGKLPQDFDSFIGVLFETTECEDFLADGTLLGVATVACAPYTCDFPRQMCMRTQERYQDETANQCIAIPQKCLTAANGGKPVGGGAAGPRKNANHQRPPPPPPPDRFGGPGKINGNKPPPVRIVTAGPDVVGPPVSGKFGDICQQTVPEGRFCGFGLKFTYNKETGNCEQFWFPGCRTEATNDNLFDTEGQCRGATQHCAEVPTTTERPMRIRVPTPQPVAQTPKPKPKKPRFTTPAPEEYPDPDPEPEIGLPEGAGAGHRGPSVGGVDFGSLAKTFMGGGGGGSGGIVGQLLGSGLGGGAHRPPPSSSVVPNGYGGASLGGAGTEGGAGNQGGGGGNGGGGNFISLIANTVKELGHHKGGHGGGGPNAAAAKVAQQWLNPNQLGSLFSGFGR